ncbi:hypothetical protein Trco_004205 [Trichoderma cornu-damae]|uniref:DNA mismatch repair protein PMS1 n=1 Tax=Trichoderma cornu-damae TaxID=654480 RepID=A0A9P8QSN5_9HYPO|nr:hypothetical protein Trco_004205 [Trichoderma cornu-damae]
MATIKQIDGRSVHQIQSGQVIVDLCSVVKELVENSIDSGATIIDVRFKNQGLDAIEVQDNGSGISPANYSSVALKHYTSKLSTFSDITSLQTFGFRGEALASLCALSILTVTTCLEQDVPKGSRLTFQQSGQLESTNVVAAQRGTTVSVENLFHNLPVRRRELDRNIKREWHKVIALLNQYACIQTDVKFSVSQQPTKGKRMLLFSTKGNPSTRDNIINIFGAKTLAALIPLDLQLAIKPSSNRSEVRTAEKLASGSHDVRIVGHVSKPVHGEGRQTPDRQMFFVNGRPCSLPQLAKTFNEVYRSYNNSQSPFIFADVQLDTTLYDVNVSPDKRSILLHDQNNLLDTLRISLSQLFDAHEDRISIATSAESMKLHSSHSKATKKGQLSGAFNKSASKSSTAAVADISPSYNDIESSSTIDSEESEQDDETPPAPQSTKTRSQDDVLVNHSPREGSSAACSPNITIGRSRNLRDLNSAIHIQSYQSSSTAAPSIPLVDAGSHSLSCLVTSPRELSTSTNAAGERDKAHETEKLRSKSSGSDKAKEHLLPSEIHELDPKPIVQQPSCAPEDTTGTYTASAKDSQRRIQALEKELGFQRVKPTIPSVGALSTEPDVQSLKHTRRKYSSAYYIQNLHVDRGRLQLLHSAHRPRRTSSSYTASKAPSVERIDASDAESRLPLIIAKDDFSKMRIIGQFNLGFIIAVKPAGHTGLDNEARHDELFIIDQHASDEKYNYEKLQNTTEIQSQRLVHPMRLQLTALEEEIVLENQAALVANGFKVNTDTTGRSPVGSRCQLMALPLSREVTFKMEDLEELISLLGDKSAESSYIPRPSKVQKMLAMRACRSSIMIGKAMTRGQMHSLINHMGELDKPWNCPHGRPTIRHLSRLQAWNEEGWKHDLHTGSITTWQCYKGGAR